MYRSAAKRLLRQSSFLYGESPRPKIFTVVRALTTNSSLRFLSTVASESPLPNQSPNGFESASSSYSESRDEDEFRRQTSRRTPPEARFEEEQARVLAASLRHVVRTSLFLSCISVYEDLNWLNKLHLCLLIMNILVTWMTNSILCATVRNLEFSWIWIGVSVEKVFYDKILVCLLNNSMCGGDTCLMNTIRVEFDWDWCLLASVTRWNLI